MTEIVKFQERLLNRVMTTTVDLWLSQEKGLYKIGYKQPEGGTYSFLTLMPAGTKLRIVKADTSAIYAMFDKTHSLGVNSAINVTELQYTFNVFPYKGIIDDIEFQEAWSKLRSFKGTS